MPGRQRVLEVKTGISFKNKPDDDPDVSIGIARLYPSLKFTLAKVKVHRETVREGEYVEVKKTVIPLLLVGRLEESRLRLDEHDGEKVFTILGSKAQLENCNALLAHVLPKGVKSLEHGLRIAYEDLQRFDSQLNGEDRAFLKDRGCEAALPDPALNVEGVVFASK